MKINGDVALLKGIQKAILEQPTPRIDREFIQRNTEGFDAYRDDLATESWENIVRGSGIAEAQIREVAAVIERSKAMICCWAIGPHAASQRRWQHSGNHQSTFARRTLWARRRGRVSGAWPDRKSVV